MLLDLFWSFEFGYISKSDKTASIQNLEAI